MLLQGDKDRLSVIRLHPFHELPGDALKPRSQIRHLPAFFFKRLARSDDLGLLWWGLGHAVQIRKHISPIDVHVGKCQDRLGPRVLPESAIEHKSLESTDGRRVRRSRIGKHATGKLGQIVILLWIRIVDRQIKRLRDRRG